MNSITKIYRHLFGIIFLSSLIGCSDNPFETTLVIDPPEHSPRLVVHAYASTSNQDINVQVDESKGLLDNTSPVRISGALVTIWKDQELIATIPEKTNPFLFEFNYVLHESGIQFEAGETYRIEVEADDYPKAIGMCTVPMPITIDQIVFEEDGPTTDDSDDNSELEIDFTDTPDLENFYEAVALLYEENGSGTPYFIEVYADSFDPAAEEGINYAAIIMNDLSFDGESKNLSIIINRLSLAEVEEKLYLSWRSTSEDHYLFNKTAQAQIEQDENPFSSPVQVYSNIDNGIGIFSIVNEELIKVQL